MSERIVERSPRRQWLVLGAIFAVVVGLLALGYFLFLRPNYVVLVQGLRPGETAPIVAELDKRGTPYRVADGGGTILVPEGQADATRVAIAGSDAMARGEIGFELFNKSDMGLTNFAQKINYQRALQGELVRTIMQEDGVDSARVHLALPERTLFRADRSEPKAAVTLTMKPGQTADAGRVAGIQRLVAAAVPDLPENQVVVLDSGGRVISPIVTAATGTDANPDMAEKAAVEGYYRARARGAVERAMPGLKFTLRVLALPIGEGTAPSASDPAAAAAADWVPSGEGAGRNFRLRMIFVSEASIGGDDQEVLRNAVFQATALNAAQGDSLSFEVGPVDPMPETAQQVPAAPPRATALPAPESMPVQVQWPSWWMWLAGALVIALLIVWRLRGSGAARLDDSDHEAFAARLRRQLNLEDGDAVA